VTVISGLCDTVAPPRVASYVWNEYLMLKPGGNRLYVIPDANHYLQADRPDAFVDVLLHALGPADGQGPGALGPERASSPRNCCALACRVCVVRGQLSTSRPRLPRLMDRRVRPARG
jgi:hypothetical protein